MDVRKKILDVLSTVQDPDLKKDLVTLNMIENLFYNESERSLSFTIVLTTPACPLREFIKKNCIDALNSEGFAEWAIAIDFSSRVLPNNIIEKSIPGVKNVVAIISGKGGVGKSTVCFRTALAMARSGAKVAILDADIFGPSIPILLGTAGKSIGVKKINDKNYMIPLENHNIKSISIDYLLESGQVPVIWRGPIASKALKQLFYDTEWGEIDYLFIDMPPGTSDLHITLAQAIPLTGVVVVTTPQKLSCADAIKAIEMFKKQFSNIPLLGLIENMSHFLHKNIEIDMFGSGEPEEIAKKYKIPFLGKIPLIKSIAENYLDSLSEENLRANITFEDISGKIAQIVSILNADSKNLH